MAMPGTRCLEQFKPLKPTHSNDAVVIRANQNDDGDDPIQEIRDQLKSDQTVQSPECVHEQDTVGEGGGDDTASAMAIHGDGPLSLSDFISS